MTLAVSSVHKTSTPTSSQIHSLILTISQKSHRDRGFMVIAIFTLPLEDVSSIFGIINCIITTLKILTSASCMKYHWIALIPTVFLLLAYLELWPSITMLYTEHTPNMSSVSPVGERPTLSQFWFFPVGTQKYALSSDPD